MACKISIIGCGWLGFPLAITLINNGYIIKGSTTSKNKLKLLKEHKISPYLVSINEATILGNSSDFLSGSDTLIITIPPGLRKNPNKNHVTEIKNIVNIIEKSSIKHILYISSTSVFKNDYNFQRVTESQAPNATTTISKQLIEIERILQHNSKFKTTILRFGGLFDAIRHPAKFLSGKSEVKNPEAPLNLIHKEDCIEIICRIIENNIWNTSLNAVFPFHPSKRAYYTSYCKKHQLPLPEFNNSIPSKGKIIDSSKVIQLLNYTFKQVP